MRTLQQITDAARRNEPVSELELRFAVCAYDVLLAQLELEKDPKQLQKFFVAAEADPRAYIGPANNPLNAEARDWHKAFINVGDTKAWNCSTCGADIQVPSDYEPEGCCSGRECGCMGREINPVFCSDCENKLFKPSKEETDK